MQVIGLPGHVIRSGRRRVFSRRRPQIAKRREDATAPRDGEALSPLGSPPNKPRRPSAFRVRPSTAERRGPIL